MEISSYVSAISKVAPGSFVPDMADESPTVTPLAGEVAGAGEAASKTSFADTLKGYLSDVNAKINTSDTNSRDLASGRTNDLSKVVTSVEEANLALQTTMAVRTKLIEAYSEIARMQI